MDSLHHFKNSRPENPFLLKNRYTFVKPLQVGSYGEVVLAIDCLSNQYVAIKIMTKQQKGSSVIARHELSILKRINYSHKHLCSLLDNFQTESHYCMVFEYCLNGDLYDYIANPINDNYKLHFKTLIKELYQIITYSHSKGIYHRDIKPENILIDESKSIKLTDWGLSTLSINASDPLIGTEKYMAPETFFKQSKNNKENNNNNNKSITYNTKFADYWSLGITLLYVLFKRCPWKLANLSDPNFNKFSKDPMILFKWYPNLSNFGFDCILTLLEINPSHRSLDYFFELSCVKGFANSFLRDESDTINTISSSSSLPIKNFTKIEVTEINPSSSSSDDDDDLLFGLEIDNPIVSSFKKEFKPTPSTTNFEDDDYGMDLLLEEELFDSSINGTFQETFNNTPFTPAIQTPIDTKVGNLKTIPVQFDDTMERIKGMNPEFIKNSPLKFEKLDWF